MAGIEKVCEFSGDYGGWNMYSYKKNQIQILPKYRHLFRGAEHKLHIWRPQLRFVSKLGGSSDYSHEIAGMKYYDPPFKSVKDFLLWKKEVRKERVVKEYIFSLEVMKDSLQGNVGGWYLNQTFDLATTKRKLKRLLRTPQLVIVYHDMDYYEWLKNCP